MRCSVRCPSAASHQLKILLRKDGRMDETADLGDIESFLTGITTDITSAYKTFNQPNQIPTPGTAVPGRPGYVYGAGGAIFPINPATGLPVVNSTPVGATSTSTLWLIGIAAALFGAFAISIFRK